MIDVYAVDGTFNDRHGLAQQLAAAVMRWEAVPPISLFQDNTAAFIHDLPRDAISNVAGASETSTPSLTVWFAPASTEGATLLTVTWKASVSIEPSSSVTVTVTTKTPLSAYTCVPEREPFRPSVLPGGPKGVSVTVAG